MDGDQRWQKSFGMIPSRRPAAVDGRGNGGKTTLAARIAKASPGSAVVHTDVIVCGTPEVPCDPVTEIVVAPALQRACVGEAGVGGDD